MAGTRKSHNKSKNGCNRCRRRHVRCDETLPECAKCISLNQRCDFLDGPPLALLGSRGSRRLLPTIEQAPAITSKGDTALQSTSHVDCGLPMTPLSPEEGLLLHHLSSNLTQTKTIDISKCVVNIAFMPKLLAIAEAFDFVRHAALSVSASRFAYGKDKAEYRLLAQKYQLRAVQGLRLSLPQLDKRNADAVLATSILLSWQAADASSFASFTCGTASIIESVHPWSDGVFLGDVVTNPLACASNLQVRRGIPVPRPPALRNEERIHELIRTPLAELCSKLSGHKAAQDSINLLLEVTRNLKNPLARTDLQFRFSILQPGLSQVVWLPILLKEPHVSKWALLILAFWYAAIMSLEPIRYAPVSQLLKSSLVATVRSISDELQTVSNSSDRQAMLRLMALPLAIATDVEEGVKCWTIQVKASGLSDERDNAREF